MGKFEAVHFYYRHQHHRLGDRSFPVRDWSLRNAVDYLLQDSACEDNLAQQPTAAN